MTGITVVPVDIRLTIGGVSYPLIGVDVNYTTLGINSCVCSIAVGRGASSGSGAPVSLAFTRNTAAQVHVYSDPISTNGQTDVLPPNGFLVFDGFVDVGGPTSVSFGGFSAQVRLMGKLSKLNNGTVQTSNIVPSSYADTTVNLNRTLVLSPLADIAKFGTALTSALVKMATGGVADTPGIVVTALRAAFGETVNAEAAAMLGQIVSHLDLRSDLVEGHAVTLHEMYIQSLTASTRMDSFYRKLLHLTDALKFRLLEIPGGIYLVPYNPIFPISFARDITPQTYSSLSWSTEGASQYAGAALIGKAKGEPIVVGLYQRPGGAGLVMTEMAPQICMYGGGNAVTSPMLAKVTADRTAPFFIENIGSLGDNMARQLCLERIYAARQVQITVPFFRVDIGPLSSVRILYPEITDQLGAEVYGSVQQVRISINASSKTATTTYDVGYVRSYSEQQSDIEDAPDVLHPIWAYNLYGTRLDRFSA